MDRSHTEAGFYHACELTEVVSEATSAASTEAASSSMEASSSGHLAVMTPKSARELAEIYGVTDKSVQTWFKTVCDAYCWLDPLDLKVGTSNKIRYTPLCQQLIAAYRSSGMNAEQWVNQIHAENKEKLKSPSASTQPPALPVVEAELEQPTALTVGSRGELSVKQFTRQVQPLLQISIESLQIQLPQADVSGLNADTEKLQGINQQAVQVLTQFVSADLQSKVTELLSQNSNLAAAIQTAATVGAVQGIQNPKPQAEAAGTTS